MPTHGAMPNSFDPTRADALEPRARALVARRRRLLGPGYKLFYEQPIEVVRGEGVHLFDADGNAYLDAYNNVPCVGHCHPHVVEAIARQAGTLNSNTRYLAEPLLDYAERLLATHHEGLGSVMLACSGSEATDLALRIARHATGAKGVVVTANAYHGVTAAAAEVSPSLGANEPLGVHVRTVAPPGPGDTDAGAAFALRVEEAIVDLRRHGTATAAVLMDTLLSSDGLVPDPPGFLRPVADVAHAAGALFIADEVQAGFGRTGAAMWGYQRHGIEPDLVTMGKPMGNGVPISGVAARPELLERFGNEVRYFNTFGANSIAIAAAAAVLDVIEGDDLVARVGEAGAHLRTGLAGLAREHTVLRNVRGAGLYVAADLVDPATGAPDARATSRVVNGLRERRVLISAAGATASALKVRPPLPFGRDHADQLLAALADVLAAAC
ncbi:MAG: aminotransferase class III-fold pyridoxal phosphate-dependent enzyme [Solirubrobacteraceae bacterium]